MNHNLVAQDTDPYNDVMLQGFAWNTFTASSVGGSTKWTALQTQVQEIGESFDMIWLPPSSAAEGGGSRNMGYHPWAWNSQSSSWGTSAELKALIIALHTNSCKVLADIVVNHRAGGTTWNDFKVDNYGSSYTTYQLTSTHICKDDEAANSGYAVGPNYDYNWNVSGDLWGGYSAARDLDHSQEYVRSAIKEYLSYLKNDIGYDGWRYDLTKGYRPQYAKEYTEASNAYFSVGEYWSGDYNQLVVWVMNAGSKVSTFDFANKYAINNWNGGTNYAALTFSDAGTIRPKGLVQSTTLRKYAVTFVDNHDTHPPHSNPQNYTGDIPKAYAYLLSNPGVPCVFWIHWVNNKTVIKQMISARKTVGLHANSDVVITNTNGYYESHSTGQYGELICRIGTWTAGTPTGYTLACSGNGWAYYSKINSNSTLTQEDAKVKFQNPVSDELSIETVNKIEKIQIISVNGQVLLSSNSNIISTSSLASGLYLLTIKFENGEVFSDKFSVRH
jgi:alpha-amylase